MTKANTLTISVDSKGFKPYSKNAPVQALYATLNPILGQLVYTNQNYDLRPGLLESFRWDHKKGVYVLRLRGGLTFHNGRKASAVDLEFSILRGFFTPKRSFFAGFFNNIQGIEKAREAKAFQSGVVSGVRVVNEREVEVKLKQPNPSFLHSLNRSFFSLVPIEAFDSKDYEAWKTGPVGAGDYKFISSENETVLQKVSSNSKAPNFLKISSDDTADVKINQLEQADTFETFFSEKATSVTNIVFNFESQLGSDINFRKAIEYAVNRDELSASSDAYRKTDQFLASHFWGRIDIPSHFDPTKAKEYISKIKGSQKSKILRIPVFNSSLGDKALGRYFEFLKKQLAKANILVEFYDSKDKFFPKDDKITPFRIITLGADVADPLVLFGLMQGKNSPLWPHFPEKDKKRDELISIAKDAQSLDKKALAVQALSRHFHDQVTTVPLFERRLFVSIKKDRIGSVGKQDGGLTFYLNRVELKGKVQ